MPSQCRILTPREYEKILFYLVFRFRIETGFGVVRGIFLRKRFPIRGELEGIFFRRGQLSGRHIRIFPTPPGSIRNVTHPLGEYFRIAGWPVRDRRKREFFHNPPGEYRISPQDRRPAEIVPRFLGEKREIAVGHPGGDESRKSGEYPAFFEVPRACLCGWREFSPMRRAVCLRRRRFLLLGEIHTGIRPVRRIGDREERGIFFRGGDTDIRGRGNRFRRRAPFVRVPGLRRGLRHHGAARRFRYGIPGILGKNGRMKSQTSRSARERAARMTGTPQYREMKHVETIGSERHSRGCPAENPPLLPNRSRVSRRVGHPRGKGRKILFHGEQHHDRISVRTGRTVFREGMARLGGKLLCPIGIPLFETDFISSFRMGLPNFSNYDRLHDLLVDFLPGSPRRSGKSRTHRRSGHSRKKFFHRAIAPEIRDVQKHRFLSEFRLVKKYRGR